MYYYSARQYLPQESNKVAGPQPASTTVEHNQVPTSPAMPAAAPNTAPTTEAAPAPTTAPTHQREKSPNVPGAEYQLPVLGQGIGDLYNQAKTKHEVPGNAQEGIELQAELPLKGGKGKLMASARSTILGNPDLLNKVHVGQKQTGNWDFDITFTKKPADPANAWSARCTDQQGNKVVVTAGHRIELGTGQVINDAVQAQDLLKDMAVASEGIIGQAMAQPAGVPIVKSPVEGFCAQFN